MQLMRALWLKQGDLSLFPRIILTFQESERVTSCYDTYMLVGVNIKREMVLSPNFEEAANSSTKRTQFKTRVHKPYLISVQNGRN